MKTRPTEPAPGWLRRVARRLLPALLVGLASAPAWAAGFDLEALMALLAQRRGGEARFTEERTVSTLDTPLYASGRLTFAAPNRFARYTELPRPESMEIDGNNVVLKRGGRTRQLTLDAIPELAALADAVRGTLSGDGAALKKRFVVNVSGGAGKWVLSLTPIDVRLARQVRQLDIAGQGADVRSIELQLVGGDRSLMQVQPLVPATPASAPK